ncbi:MAG TPA: metal-dependent hydrolase [Elusimicrobiota bacterium]|nr:metal-dependent hydrolase [Elusimicrobiota bacterium]
MKGLTHFLSGIAAATFIPEVVKMSTQSRVDTVDGAANSFILLLAGAFGLLPDTLDFKVGQYFSPAEFEIDPDPRHPDPQAMADQFAAAIAHAGRTGKFTRVQFYPTHLGASLWRQYVVLFPPKEVIIQFNELVKTSQCPIQGTAPKTNRVGRAKLEYELKARNLEIDWLNKAVRFLRHRLKGPDKEPTLKPSTVEIFSGAQFGFQLESDGKLYFNWLPWHRTWSHSWVLGFLLTIPIHLVCYLSGFYHWWLYGIAAFIGFFTHVAEDMTGHIGGSLFWPLHKPRSEGLELFKASDPRTNFSVMYTAIFFVIWNTDRFSTQLIPLAGWQVMLYFWVIPMAIYFYAATKIKDRINKKEDAVVKSIYSEEEEPDGIGDSVID